MPITMTTILEAWQGFALAYIGPGAGISAIGTLLVLLGAVLLSILGFVWFPLKRLLRNKNSKHLKDKQD